MEPLYLSDWFIGRVNGHVYSSQVPSATQHGPHGETEQHVLGTLSEMTLKPSGFQIEYFVNRMVYCLLHRKYDYWMLFSVWCSSTLCVFAVGLVFINTC